jgi:glutathione synthase/RimK-type ligase-like ATP-grasp enzyme
VSGDSRPSILIVSVAEDLHALTVQREVRESDAAECHIIECDRIAHRDSLSYGIGHDVTDRAVTSEGRSVRVSDAAVLWLRTIGPRQVVERQVSEDAAIVIDNDCRGGLSGLLESRFKGTWISAPEATYRASDKLGQLAVAHRCGFRVPRTLVSQSRRDVMALYDACDGGIVVKTVVGAPGPFLQAVKLDSPGTLDYESYSAAPAIYQEYIPGVCHLRLNCFGPRSYAALIRSDDVDWRARLGTAIESYDVSPTLHRKVRDVLDALGLAMGIVDLKLTPAGEPVWLEVNPQGQFLFLEAYTDLHLAKRFAEYLIDVCADGSPG